MVRKMVRGDEEDSETVSKPQEDADTGIATPDVHGKSEVSGKSPSRNIDGSRDGCNLQKNRRRDQPRWEKSKRLARTRRFSGGGPRT